MQPTKSATPGDSAKPVNWERLLAKRESDATANRFLSILKLVATTATYCTLIGSAIDLAILYTNLGAILPLIVMVTSIIFLVSLYASMGSAATRRKTFAIALFFLVGSTLTFVVVRLSHSENGGFIANHVAGEVDLQAVFENLRSGQEGTNKRIEDVATDVGDLVSGQTAVAEARKQIFLASFPETLDGLYQAIASGDPSVTQFAVVGIRPSLEQIKDFIVRAGGDSDVALRHALRFVAEEVPGIFKSEINSDLLDLLPRITVEGELNRIRNAACNLGDPAELLWTSKIFAHECGAEYDWYDAEILRFRAVTDFLGYPAKEAYLPFISTSTPIENANFSNIREGIQAYNVVFMPRQDADGSTQLTSIDFLKAIKIYRRFSYSGNCQRAISYGGYCSAIATFYMNNVQDIIVLALSHQRELSPTHNIESSMRAATDGLPWTAIPGALSEERSVSLEMYDKDIGLGVRIECASDARISPRLFAGIGRNPNEAADIIFGELATASSAIEASFDVEMPELNFRSSRKIFVPKEGMVRADLPEGFLDLMRQEKQMLMRVGKYNAIVDLTGFATALAKIDNYAC